VSAARDIAVRVLERVETDGAYAAAALDAELDRDSALDPRDRALATELVYGVLRTRRALVNRIEAHARRGVSDPFALRVLLVAAYQILLLERIPARAAVNEAVASVERKRGKGVAGFANAVLRKLAEPAVRLDFDEAMRESAPPWLLERLERDVGRTEAEALFGIGVPLAERHARVITGAKLPAWLERAERGRTSPLARLLPAGDPEKLEGYADGAFAVQEQGAQLVALALGARPGERVLDACAGRGQKTSLLVERVGQSGDVWATDVHRKKLVALGRELERLRLPGARTAEVDWTRDPDAVPSGFDRVLVDAPCSGVGTLRRRPEIARRLGEGDPARLAELALAILRGAAGRARTGGRVVFAVCSVLFEEAEAVVERVSDVLEPAPFDAPDVEPLAKKSPSAFRLLPVEHGTDGYFVASFVKR
jgi:16S rRNA (cytosine967-C5)-methyltransferase